MDLQKLESLEAEQQLASFCQVDCPKALDTINEYGGDKVDWRNPVLSRLPHLCKLRMANTLVSKGLTCPAHSATLQVPNSEPMGQKELASAMLVLANNRTLGLLAGALHELLYAEGKVVVGTALSTSLQFIIVALGKTLVQSQATLASTNLQALEDMHMTHGMTFNLAFLRQFTDGVKAFWQNAVSQFLMLGSEELRILARKLESKMPRWEPHVTASNFNAAYAYDAVERNAHAKDIVPARKACLLLRDGLLTFASIVESGAAPLDKRPNFDDIFEHASSVVGQADTVTLVSQCLKTLFVEICKNSAPTAAKACMSYSKSEHYKGTPIPASLWAKISSLAEGDTSVMDGIDVVKIVKGSAARPSLRKRKGTKEELKAEKEEEDEAMGDEKVQEAVVASGGGPVKMQDGRPPDVAAARAQASEAPASSASSSSKPPPFKRLRAVKAAAGLF